MILLILITNLWASDVVIQGTQTQDITLERHLLSRPNQQSYIQHLNSRSSSLQKKLHHLLKKAQFHFLSGELQQAKLFFQKIADLQHRASWNRDQRKVIHFSFLRLAQLSQSPADRQALVKKAVAFDDQLPLDKKIFPPPFVELYRITLKGLKKNVWPLPSGSDVFRQILINGRKVANRGGFLLTHSQEQRISFQSNQFQEVVLVGKPKELLSGKLSQVPLAQGNCHNPDFHIPIPKGHRFVYLEEGCSKTAGPTNSAPTLPLTAQVSPESSKPVASIYRNKWFWVGLSVIATGLAYNHLNTNKGGGSVPAATNTQVQTFTNQ